MRGWCLKNSREIKAFTKITSVIITVSILCGLCGCSALAGKIRDSRPKETASDPVSSDEDKKNPGAIQVIDINGDVHETSVDVIEEGETEDNASNPLPDRSLAQVAQNLSLSDDVNFAYSELSDSAKECYTQIYAILTDMLEKVDITSLDPDEVDLAFRAVMVDHPEIFYVKGYSIGKYMAGNTLKKIAFTGTYTMSKDEVVSAREEVEDYVQNVVENAPADAGDFDKIKYVYDYLIRHNEYVPDSKNNQNILSVVQGGKTVCQGYTKMMQLILNRMGIFCTLVNGKACGRNGVPDSQDLSNAENAEWGGHVWNIVECNGMYYNVDVTWGDAAITLMNSDGTLSDDVDVNYEFFLVDDSSLDQTHDPEPVVSMPRCNSMEDNYYSHEGLYFTGIDPDQFRRAFESAYASGETILFLKASSPEVYKDMAKHLFDDQNVFEYMGRTNVRYVGFSERNLIMISL